MKQTLRELLCPQPKSKIKAGDGQLEGAYNFYTSSQIQSKFYHSATYNQPALIFGTGGMASVHFCEKPFSTSTDCLVMYGHKGVQLELIYHYLRTNLHILQEGFKGAGLQHISKDYILDIEIDMPNPLVQAQITLQMRLIDRLIEQRKQQLVFLNEAVKSRFIELLGMPGADDFDWGLVPLGSVCHINPKKSQDPRLGSGIEVSFVPMPAVTEHGEIDATSIKEYDEVKTGFTYFAENDVLFAKITPCMENGKGAVARGLHNGIGFGSTEFHVLRPISGKTNPYWIYMLTAFPQFREDAANNMTGSAGQRRVPASYLENYRVAVPPIELQEQFAAFVEQTDKSKFLILYMELIRSHKLSVIIIGGNTHQYELKYNKGGIIS